MKSRFWLPMLLLAAWIAPVARAELPDAPSLPPELTAAREAMAQVGQSDFLAPEAQKVTLHRFDQLIREFHGQWETAQTLYADLAAKTQTYENLLAEHTRQLEDHNAQPHDFGPGHDKGKGAYDLTTRQLADRTAELQNTQRQVLDPLREKFQRQLKDVQTYIDSGSLQQFTQVATHLAQGKIQFHPNDTWPQLVTASDQLKPKKPSPATQPTTRLVKAPPAKPNPNDPISGDWTGTWESPEGFVYEAQMHLKLTDTNIEGAIDWTLKVSPRPEEQNKIGQQGTEHIKGKYTPTPAVLTLKGHKLDDPNHILGQDQYRLLLSDDKKVLGGITYNHGSWSATLVLHRQQ